MKKIALGILIAVVMIALTVSVALALPKVPASDTAKKASRAIDEDTGEVKAPPEFVAELPESELTKIVFIRFAPKFAKKPCNNDGTCDTDEGKWCSDCKNGGEEPTSACYGFLAGSKPSWNWVEDYVYSDEDLVIPSFDAITTWEAPVLEDIFGDGSYVDPGVYPWGEYDYINSISYGDYDDTGMCLTSEPCVIAVTAIWFRGKNIYEYDIMFDTNFFPGNFDLPTVTLHEFGHGAGLDDLYDTTCLSEVMYGYLSEEEVKTSLGDGDTVGIQKLYGE